MSVKFLKYFKPHRSPFDNKINLFNRPTVIVIYYELRNLYFTNNVIVNFLLKFSSTIRPFHTPDGSTILMRYDQRSADQQQESWKATVYSTRPIALMMCLRQGL